MAYDSLIEEVNQEMRRENMRNAWQSFGKYIIGLTLLILMGTIGSVIWKNMQETKRVKMTAHLVQADRLFNEGKPDGAIAELNKLTPMQGDISAIAHIWKAQIHLDQGHEDLAKKELGALDGAYGSDIYADFANLIEQTLEQTDKKDEPKGAFTLNARELAAINAYHAGDMKKAAHYYQQIATDAQAPGSLRERAELILSTVLANVDVSE